MRDMDKDTNKIWCFLKTVSTLMWTGGLTGIYGAMGNHDKLLREVVLINIMTNPSKYIHIAANSIILLFLMAE